MGQALRINIEMVLLVALNRQRHFLLTAEGYSKEHV